MTARAALAAVTAGVVAGCGGSDEPPPRDPFRALERDAERPRAERRAAPRWERVTVLRGTGTASRRVTVAPGAIQWRVRATCRAGDLAVAVRPAPAGGSSLRADCPGAHGRTFIGRGDRTLRVDADGAWRLVVEQQVETPLAEPPLPAMTARGARAIARGRFASLEQPSGGRATLYRLAGGRLALRLTGFRTSANTDLYVWLSRARRPRTTRAVLRAPYRVLRSLKATVGDQNYLLPAGTRAGDVRSVVIWCEPIRIAYAAASLRPAGDGDGREGGSATNSS